MKPFKVVCIEKSLKNLGTINNFPKVGEVYEIKITIDDTRLISGLGYVLYEIPDAVFDSGIFRPVDYSYGEVVCETIEEQIKYEEAISV